VMVVVMVIVMVIVMATVIIVMVMLMVMLSIAKVLSCAPCNPPSIIHHLLQYTYERHYNLFTFHVSALFFP
jgi:hypothetical protein